MSLYRTELCTCSCTARSSRRALVQTRPGPAGGLMSALEPAGETRPGLTLMFRPRARFSNAASDRSMRQARAWARTDSSDNDPRH